METIKAEQRSPLLEVRDLSVVRGAQPRQLLSQLSFSLYRGEILGVLGDSGVGKSSMLRALMGLERASQGELRWLELSGLACAERSPRFAWVPQESALFPHLTVRENICFSAPYLSPSPSEVSLEERLAWLGDRLSVDELFERLPHQLSGGQRQRVALARALFTEAPALLLDEPLAHLDAASRAQLRALITSLVRERELACVWVSHDREEALEVSDRLAVLHQGRLEGPLTVAEALTQPPSRAFAERLGELMWFPTRREGEVWRWGPLGSPTLWRLDEALAQRAQDGGLIGVRASGWRRAPLDRGEGAERALTLKVWRSRPSLSGYSLELKGEALRSETLRVTLTEGAPPKKGEHISLIPRDLIYVQGAP